MSGYERENRNVLRRCLKTTSDGAAVTWAGRSFHTAAPETVNYHLVITSSPVQWNARSTSSKTRLLGCQQHYTFKRPAYIIVVVHWASWGKSRETGQTSPHNLEFGTVMQIVIVSCFRISSIKISRRSQNSQKHAISSEKKNQISFWGGPTTSDPRISVCEKSFP